MDTNENNQMDIWIYKNNNKKKNGHKNSNINNSSKHQSRNSFDDENSNQIKAKIYVEGLNDHKHLILFLPLYFNFIFSTHSSR